MGRLVIGEFDGTWKENVGGLDELVLSCYMPGWTQINHEKSRDSRCNCRESNNFSSDKCRN